MRTVAIFTLLVLFSACSRPTLEDVTRDQLNLIEDFMNLIDKIETESDAREAIPELEKLTVRANRLKKKYHEVSIPTTDEQKALQNQFGQRAIDVYGRFAASSGKNNWDPGTEKLVAKSAAEFMRIMFEEKK